jgi:hypothetical protein
MIVVKVTMMFVLSPFEFYLWFKILNLQMNLIPSYLQMLCLYSYLSYRTGMLKRLTTGHFDGCHLFFVFWSYGCFVDLQKLCEKI